MPGITNDEAGRWQEAESGRFAACLPALGQRMAGKDFLRLTETRIAQLFPGLLHVFLLVLVGIRISDRL